MDNNTTNSIVKVDPSTESITIQGSGGIVTTPRTIYNALVRNDFTQADDAIKASAIQAVCGALGVSPMPAPFAFIKVQGATKMYPTAELFEMLAARHGLEVVIEKEGYDERTQCYIIHGYCQSKDGRKTSSMAALNIPKASVGEAYANGIMKAHTKFKRRAVKGHVGLTIPGWSADDALDEIAETEPINRADIIKAFHATANGAKWFTADTKEAEQAKRHEFYAKVLGREIGDFSEVSDKEALMLLEALQLEIHNSTPADPVEQQVIDAEYSEHTQATPQEVIQAAIAEVAQAAIEDDDTPFPGEEQASPTPVEDDTLTYGVYETMVSEAAELGIKMHIRAHREKWAMLAKLEGEPGWIETGWWKDIKDKATTTTKLAAVIAEMKSKAVAK